MISSTWKVTIMGVISKKDGEPVAIVPVHGHELGELLDLPERIRKDYDAGSNKNTERAYDGDWDRWQGWCISRRIPSVPPDARAMYAYASWLADEGKRAATIDRAIAAISTRSELMGHPKPVFDKRLQSLMKGVRKRAGRRPRPMTPLMPLELARALETQGATLREIRDRALLLIGLAGAFRRSELVSIQWEEVVYTDQGVRIYVPESKTDKEEEGAWVAIEHGDVESTCPVAALSTWEHYTGRDGGPVFRQITRMDRVLDKQASDSTVARVVKWAAEAAELDPTLYSGHSLRSGYATAAALVGKRLEVIMKHGRWKRVESTNINSRLWVSKRSARPLWEKSV